MKRIFLILFFFLAGNIQQPQPVSGFFIRAALRMFIKTQARIEANVKKTSFEVPFVVSKNGYPVETHEVVTEDRYVLTMHRIPYSRKYPLNRTAIRPAIYIQHGILGSSADHVTGIPEKSLGYLLADAGYDVWMGNYRGNIYSRKHLDLDPDDYYDSSFWYFGYDQFGKYDIPAMIDHVINVTQQEKIHYIGHSMGTTAFMVAMNLKPEYAKKIKMANLMAPVAYLKNIVSPLFRFIARYVNHLETLVEMIGMDEFLPNNWLLSIFSNLVCDSDGIPEICSNILFVFAGFSRAQTNLTLLPIILNHSPSGASAKMFAQYGQQVTSGKFCQYDHGNEENMQIYGQPDPPLYYVQNVKVPVSTYYGKNDRLTAQVDYDKMLNELPNIFDNYTVPYEKWNHVDFLWGIDANILLFPRVMKNIADAEEIYQKENENRHYINMSSLDKA